MKRTKLLVVVMCVACVLGWAFTSWGADAKLELQKTNYTPGAKIKVKFTAPSSFEKNAWVGIIPSGVKHGKESVNDENDITYQYLNNRTSGELTFTAPAEPGSYDLRMNDSDTSGKEVASVTFAVGGTSGKVAAATNAELKIGKDSYKPGQSIKVTFATPAGYAQNAWVGIIPSNVKHGKESVNDEHDISYQYLNGKTQGTLTFKAPGPGSYDLRMHDTDNNGKEVASVPFSVK